MMSPNLMLAAALGACQCLLLLVSMGGGGLLAMGAPVKGNAVALAENGLCASLVLPLGAYDCQEYMVETGDQFLLGVQRVSKKGSARLQQNASPVLLLHGILLGGDVWVLNPPEQALAFVLADAGYDVWIGNTRTTRFTFGHVAYTKKDKGFWDWSVDELAQYDLPAMLGFVKEQTNKKVHYIGYSQGSQQYLIAASQGQLADVVDKVVLLAPIAYVNDVPRSLSTLAASLYLDRLFFALHVYEFSTQLRGKEVVDIICKAESRKCFQSWITLFTGNNCCLNYTMRPVIDKYETQPTATKNLVHLGQQYRHKTFAKFDYGFWGNLMKYWRLTPPSYDLAKVPTNNVLFLHGGRDILSDPKDVALLFSDLIGQCPIRFIPDYAHIDFILATNAKVFVYDLIMEFLTQQT